MRYSFVVGAASLALVYAAPTNFDNGQENEQDISPAGYGQGSVYGNGEGRVAVSPVQGGARADAGAGGQFGRGANFGGEGNVGGGAQGGKSTIFLGPQLPGRHLFVET